MLKSSHRLSNKEFMEVMEKGRVQHSPLFLMRVIQVKSEKSARAANIRISAVAPKKVAPTAVLRNSIRRRIYEGLKPIMSSIAPGMHAIVFAKTDLSKTAFKDIEPDLKILFSKARISV